MAVNKYLVIVLVSSLILLLAGIIVLELPKNIISKSVEYIIYVFMVHTVVIISDACVCTRPSWAHESLII